MKYTVSDIIRRAEQFADVVNTSFLTHKELTEYVNDSWRELYQIFINNGEKQFIKEVALQGSTKFNGFVEYNLPSDLYSIYSIKQVNGGLLSRHVESETNLGYEVVNDKLRIYGSYNNLIMTYYTTPTYLSYPDKTLDDVHIDGISLDTVCNSIMYHDNDHIYVYNLLTKEVISGGTIAYSNDYHYVLGNGHILVYSDTLVAYYDYDGNELYGTEIAIDGVYKDWNGYVYYVVDNKLYLFGSEQFNTISANNGVITQDYTIGFDEHNLYLNIRRKAFELEEAVVINNEDYSFISLFPLKEKFDNKDAVIVTRNDGYHMMLIDDSMSVEFIPLDIFAPISLGVTNYGIITSNGSDTSIVSLIPDTLLNFPNELYFTLLAANVAIRIVSKQNVANEGLDQLYDNSMSLYLNSLGQDADYSRIKNIYI